MRVILGNWFAVGGSSESFFLFFCANGNEMEVENKQERERHLYFIGLDAVMPVKLMLQLSRGEGAEMVEQEQINKGEGTRGKKKG